VLEEEKGAIGHIVQNALELLLQGLMESGVLVEQAEQLREHRQLLQILQSQGIGLVERLLA
jgi:hypothetical protein